MFNAFAFIAWLCSVALLVLFIFALPLIINSAIGIVICFGVLGVTIGLAIVLTMES